MSNLTELKQRIAALPAEYTATWHDKEGNPFDIDHADLQALASSHDALLQAAKDFICADAGYAPTAHEKSKQTLLKAIQGAEPDWEPYH